MDLIDRIKEIAKRYDQQKENIQTEEATKNALIMPFISALGYDVFNPSEVVPEFIADIGTKKGEKVDYAIKKDNQIILLIECKHCGADLHSEHASQLYRYFSTTAARFGVLTNGLDYQFYSDIEEPNKMDENPFFEFNIQDITDHHLIEIKKFAKSAFCLDDIINSASALKYKNAIIATLETELSNPSDAFVKFFISTTYNGKATKQVVEQFTDLVKEASHQFIKEKIRARLNSALSSQETLETKPAPVQNNEDVEKEPNDSGIITTEEEIEAFHIIKALLRDLVDVSRIAMRDTKSYCGILLDDNNRKPICRLHFNYSQKYIEIITNKAGEKHPINDLNDIYRFCDSLKSTLKEYE